MFFMPLGSWATQRNVNPRLIIALTAIVCFPLLFLCTVVPGFTGFACLYIVAFSLNNGFVYMVPVHHGWLWFPRNAGLVSGIIIGGFGFGGLIFDNLCTRLINPEEEPVQDNGYYPEDVNNRFISMFRIFIACIACLALIGILMIFPGPVPTSPAYKEVPHRQNPSVQLQESKDYGDDGLTSVEGGR